MLLHADMCSLARNVHISDSAKHILSAIGEVHAHFAKDKRLNTCGGEKSHV